MPNHLNRAALERLKALVRAGKYVDKAWSFSAADGNAILGDPPNWTEYSKWFLGRRDGSPDPLDTGAKVTKEDFDYPFGKGGVVYLSALRAIASRASGQNDASIGEAASAVLADAQQQKSDRTKAKAVRGGKSEGGPDEGKKLSFTAPVDIKAAEVGEDGKAKGPPSFHMVAYTGVPMKLEGWKWPVVVDLDGIEGLDRPNPAYLQHDENQIVGHLDDTRVDDGKLLADGIFSGHGEAHDKVLNSAEKKFPWQASIGASTLENEFIPRGQTGQANGKTWKGPINIARRSSLNEISFVPRGADNNTSAHIAASAAGDSPMKKKFAAWMKARGYKADALDGDALAAAKALYKAEMKCEADDENDEDYDPATDTNDDDGKDKKPAKAAAKKPGKKAIKAAAGDVDGGAQDPEDDDDDVVVDPKKIAAEAAKETRKQILAERKRINAITAKLDEYRERVDPKKFEKIEAKALGEDEDGEGWDVDKVELELLRAARPESKSTPNGAFGINVGAGGEPTTEIIASAAAIAGGVGEKAACKGLTEQQANIVVSRPMRQAAGSIYGLCAIVAAAHGVRLPSPRMDEDTIRAMFRIDKRVQEMDIRAEGAMGGYSTMSLSGITENILNKALLEAYALVSSLVSEISYETDTNDFKQYKRYRLTASGILQALGAAGELKSISLQDESYPNQVKTQGVIMTVGRDVLLNDDMGALTAVPTVLGRGAALYREMMVFGTYLAAKTTVAPGGSVGQAANSFNFFSSGAGNYLTGASSALGIDSLSSAVQKFEEQTDANNMPVMVPPTRLLTCPALRVTSQNLFNGANLVVSSLGSTASRKVEPNLNAHQGKYKPLISPFLSASVGAKLAKLKGDAVLANFANASDTAWSLLADPSGGFSPLQIGYLRGQRVPIIERGEANFNTLGMAMRCYYDFGVSLHDYRCAVWSDGA